MGTETFKRKTPEEILQSISKLHRGRFKVYIGAVSGSGKRITCSGKDNC